MEESDSENEGQLLIDESVDTSKRSRATRKRGPVAKKSAPKQKKSLKIVLKAPTATSKQRGRKPKKAEIVKAKNFETNESTSVRISARVRKRVRKHSPSPVRTKKEPSKKKLKVKIKNVSKFQKKKKPSLPPTETVTETLHKTPTENRTSQALENVDIESVSDEEQLDIQYSVIMDEDPTNKIKKSSKPKKKPGIKLKLSLGKVLSPNIVDAFDTEEKIEEALPNTEISSPKTPEEDTQVVKPLVISKRRVSSEMDPNSKSQISIIPTGKESPYYSSSSEDHKPLTLRLSVGRPKIPKRSISEFENPNQTYPKPFHNLQRSWSVAPYKNFESEPKPAFKVESNMPKQEQPTEKLPTPPQNVISSTSYCNIGLQSLLDVVSVEINEQKKANYDESNTTILSENITKQSSPPKSLHLLSTAISPSKLLKSPSFERLPHSHHEGHLPSMAFPKPALHFSSKKRPRIKSFTNVSPLQKDTSDSENVVEVKGHEKQKEEVEPPDASLTDKERRRRDKKKTLNDDFVDPDSLLQGQGDIEVKRLPKKPLPSYIPKAKGIGFSLLTPQMKSQPAASEPKTLQMGGNFSLSNKNAVSRKPRKGMATAKQRLANKLKIGRAFSH